MKKMSILGIVAFIVFAMMGFGFAMWSDTVSVSASTQAGTLKFHYITGTATSDDEAGDTNGDLTCDYGLSNIRVCPEAKNIGSTVTTMEDTNSDGYQDKVNVTVTNAYPCYFNDVSWWVINDGTIPLIIQGAKLTWGGVDYDIISGALYVFCKDPAGSYSLIKVPATEMSRLEQYYQEVNGVIEFKWGDNVGLQLHPSESVEQSFQFHVVQSAEQNATYNFGMSIKGIQWNESPISGHRP